jgi:ribonucleoside-diphosphate reductase alpha chain
MTTDNMSTTRHHMYVIKRNRQQEDVSFDKIARRIEGLTGDLDAVDSLVITQKVIERIYPGIHTYMLDDLAAEICASMTADHPDFGTLASRIAISNNQKMTSPSFSETVMMMYRENRDDSGLVHPLVSDAFFEFVMANREKINDAIDYRRDDLIDYFGFKTLEKSYLTKVNGRVVERIQHMWMRVSIGLYIGDLQRALESYEFLSQKYFIHATPTLFNSGTNHSQLLSCFLLGMEDSLTGIYKTISDTAAIEKWAGGVGINVGDIRPKGAYIRGTNGHVTGIVPMLRVLNDTALYVNQGGRRPGSIAVYLPVYHPEIMSFCDLRKNHGNEAERCRDLFTAVMIPDLFMRRVEQNGVWSMFNSNRHPELFNAYGPEFERLYMDLESSGQYMLQLPAQDIYAAINRSRIETGTPYVLFTDSINMKSNQSNIGMIKNSNLCAEICEVSTPTEYACCTLASIALPSYVRSDGVFDHAKLVEVMQVVVRNLNRVIDINYYPVAETARSNLRHRPIGIGVQGLADVYAMMRMPFDSLAAKQLNREIFETMYYGAMVASLQLAKESGRYETFDGSPLSRGQFQFDMWSVTPSARYDWSVLRREIMEHGVRNSLMIALMPTASTAQILGNNECFEPYTSNIYKRIVSAGEFIVINRHLIRTLIDLGLWSPELKMRIIAGNGSIQHIQEIPAEIREIYKTVWELKQRELIDQSADRAPFVCQTQSLNLFFEEPTQMLLASATMYGWRRGLKTGSYYIRSRPKAQAQQVTVDPRLRAAGSHPSAVESPVCESCSG